MFKINRVPASVGWERNHQGKMVPQFADLRKQFDPKKWVRFDVVIVFVLFHELLTPSENTLQFQVDGAISRTEPVPDKMATCSRYEPRAIYIIKGRS